MTWFRVHGGGGGEDVSEEVAVQTPLIQQIREMIVGKATDANATEDKIVKGYSAWVGQKLVNGTLEPELLKGFKAESSTFTLSSNQSAPSVEHSLGVIPKAVFVFGDVDYTNSYYVSKYSCLFTDKGVGSASIYETKDASGGSFTSYATNAKTATATTVELSAQSMFQAGKEYTMIVIA